MNCISLDGGGVRSLSSLLIVEEIVRQYNTTRGATHNPGDVFHVAFGTSGGGLGALMIKKLGMTMANSLESLETVSRTVFGRRAFNLGRFQGGFLRRSRYNQRLLAQQIQLITGMAHMQGPPACNCYVVCRRSDQYGQTIDDRAMCFACFANGQANCLVWQAGLATSAAPTFFPPASIGATPGYFVDGGLGFNNPIDTFLDDQKSFMGISHQIPLCIVSIGTGRPMPAQVRHARRWWRFYEKFAIVTLLQSAVGLATDTENTHKYFQKISRMTPNIFYIRFNCGGGLADISLDNSSELGTITQLTRNYIANPRTQTKIRDLVNNQMF